MSRDGAFWVDKGFGKHHRDTTGTTFFSHKGITYMESVKPAISPQQAKLTDSSTSALQKYREMMVGNASTYQFIRYEILTGLLCGLPGLSGFGLRSFLYPRLFKNKTRKLAIGRNVSLRNPGAIALGSSVLIDDGVSLHASKDGEIDAGDFVSIGKNSIIAAKGCAIELSSGVNIGSNCRVASQTGITIGESTLIAAYAYIGPGNHQLPDDENDAPLISKEMEQRGGVKIGKNVWIGARATILDGVTIGDGAIVGAHSLVREDVPENTIVAGVPARVIREI